MPINPEAVLGILGNILALPKTWEDARQQQIMNNQLAGLIGQEPGAPAIPQPEPMGHFPGTQTPYLGGFLRGMGTVGQMIGAAAGQAPPAPRVDPQLLSMLLATQNRGANLEIRKEGAAEKKHEFEVRQGENEEARKFREDMAKQAEADRRANTAFQHDIATQTLGLRKEIEEDRKARDAGQPKTQFELWMQDPEKAAAYQAFQARGGKLFTPSMSQNLFAAGIDPQTATHKDVAEVSANAFMQKLNEKQETLMMQAHYKPLQAATMKEVDIIDESLPVAKDIEDLGQKPNVQRFMGPVMGGLVAQPLYSHGVQVDPEVSRYIQRTAYLRALAVGALLHGSRHIAIWKQIQAHIPDPGDRPDLQAEKVKGLAEIYSRNRDIILKDARLLQGGEGPAPAAPAPTGGAATTPGTGEGAGVIDLGDGATLRPAP